jgi:hypothetical protein
MIKAIDATQHVLQLSTQYLLSPQVMKCLISIGIIYKYIFFQNDPQLDPEYIYFHLDDTRPRAGALSKRTKITFGEGLATRRIVVFNSLNRARVEPVRLRVAQYSVKVRLSNSKSVIKSVVILQSQY